MKTSQPHKQITFNVAFSKNVVLLHYSQVAWEGFEMKLALVRSVYGLISKLQWQDSLFYCIYYTRGTTEVTCIAVNS